MLISNDLADTKRRLKITEAIGSTFPHELELERFSSNFSCRIQVRIVSLVTSHNFTLVAAEVN